MEEKKLFSQSLQSFRSCPELDGWTRFYALFHIVSLCWMWLIARQFSKRKKKKKSFDKMLILCKFIQNLMTWMNDWISCSLLTATTCTIFHSTSAFYELKTKGIFLLLLQWVKLIILDSNVYIFFCSHILNIQLLNFDTHEREREKKLVIII